MDSNRMTELRPWIERLRGRPWLIVAIGVAIIVLIVFVLPNLIFLAVAIGGGIAVVWYLNQRTLPQGSPSSGAQRGAAPASADPAAPAAEPTPGPVLFCPNCGTKRRDDARFCVECGHDLGE